MALKYLSEAGIKEIFRLVKQKYLAKADASDVATSGSYTDLVNKPTKVSEWQNDAGYLVPADIAGKANAADLKAVAFSGAYGDLTGKPTIPTVPVISTNVAQDADDNTKTVSPAAVAAYVEAAAGVTIDAAIDAESQNPVQNMAICAALAEKADGDDVTAALAGKAEALIVTAEVDFENGWVINPSTAAKVIYDASAAGKIVVGRFSHTKNGTATTTDMLLQSCNESGINQHTCVFAASDAEYHYSVLLNTLYYQSAKTVISPQEKTGTFTPEANMSAPDMTSIKQYGNIVVVSMWMPVTLGVGTGSTTLGKITGVGTPNGNYANCACVTRTPGGPAHTALLTIEWEQDGTSAVKLQAQDDNPNDTYVIFNCVYTTE